MRIVLLLPLIWIISCVENQEKEKNIQQVGHDNHVHIMSPDLISHWMNLGIPFSRDEAHYSNIDTILHNLNTKTIDLVSMAYVYGNEEFYQGDDQLDKVRSENDYVFQAAEKYPERVRPYFAVDPLKGYSLNELKRCNEFPGEKGLKLHFNASGVYLTEPEHLHQVYPIFEFAAVHDLPVLLHFDNWHPKFGRPDIRILVDSVLEKLPAMEITIAHLGTSGGFNEKTKRIIDEFVLLFDQQAIPPRHLIRFDLSAAALDKDSEGVPKLSKKEFAELKEYIKKIGLEKLVFGSDYPLYTSGEYAGILKEKLGFTDQELKLIMKRW